MAAFLSSVIKALRNPRSPSKGAKNTVKAVRKTVKGNKREITNALFQAIEFGEIKKVNKLIGKNPF